MLLPDSEAKGMRRRHRSRIVMAEEVTESGAEREVWRLACGVVAWLNRVRFLHGY